MTKELQALMNKLGYQFNDEQLLQQALTHRSLESNHNERFEFLGDSIVNFLIAELLFKKRPKSREGELSRVRASLVNREGLAEVANSFGLRDYMRMGMGELRSGGFNRPSILSDCLEAIIGAIYLDSNIDACRDVVTHWFTPLLAKLGDEESLKDPKTQLQEYLQSRKLSLPSYELLKAEGEQHEQMFFIECKLAEENTSAVGEGRSRRKAEQQAAQKILEKLKK